MALRDEPIRTLHGDPTTLAAELRVEEFDRCFSVELTVFREVNGSHPALTQPRAHPVGSDVGAFQVVSALVAVKLVVAAGAGQRVITVVADQRVVGIATDDDVIEASCQSGFPVLYRAVGDQSDQARRVTGASAPGDDIGEDRPIAVLG